MRALKIVKNVGERERRGSDVDCERLWGSCPLTEEIQLSENTYTQKKTVLTETEQAATHAAAVHLVNSIQRQHPITLDDGSFLLDY